MLDLLAQSANLPDDTHAKWYAGIVLIMAAGVAGIVLILGLILIRRLSRRWEDSIHRDIAARRGKPTPTTDLWSESAQRYVDPDALSEQELAERQFGEETDLIDDDPDGDAADNRDDEDEANAPFDHGQPPDAQPGTGFGQPTEDEDDPYGLFKDKPYVESDEDFDPDEDNEDDDEDEDGRS